MEIKNLEFFDKGKRSKVFIGYIKNRKIAAKKGKRAEIEGKWLRLLNKYNIGPKLVSVKKNAMIYKFVEGERIGDCLKNKNIKQIAKKALKQCRILDKLGINKKELTNPYKHILVDKNKVVMIDFERCYETENTKNVTQFGEYLMRVKLANRKRFIPLLKRYKEEQNEKNFKKILGFFS